MTSNNLLAIAETIFRFEVPNISKFEGIIWSPEVIVRGTWWKFEIKKFASSAKARLGVFLHCAEKKVLPNWSQVANGSVKVLSFRENVNPIERNIQPYVFDSSICSKGIGFGPFIEWGQLFDNTKGYVKDDKIILEFMVEAAKPNEDFGQVLNIEQIGMSQCSFRVTVKSIENTMAICSKPFELLDASFHLVVFRNHFNKIGVRLEPREMRNHSSIQMTMCLRLSEAESHEKCETHQMIADKYFSMLFEDEWLKSAQNRPIIVDITITAEKSNDAAPTAKRRKTEQKDGSVNLQCPICLESITHQEVSFTQCGHLFCTPCIRDSVTQHKKCPSCNTATTLKQVKRLYLPTVNQTQNLNKNPHRTTRQPF